MKRQEIKEPVLETNPNTKFVPDPEIEEIVTPLKKTLPGAEWRLHDYIEYYATMGQLLSNHSSLSDYPSIIRRRFLNTARNPLRAVDYNIRTLRFPLPLVFGLDMPALFHKQHTSLVAFGFNKVYYSTGKDRLEGIDFEKIYLNADKEKLNILKENKAKSGIYLWRNKDSGNIYIGSSIDLTRRFLKYYNVNTLIKNTNMIINVALIKYGYSSFELVILEYCTAENVISREQYYIDLLKPEYNILKKAYSWKGHHHSMETIAKFSGESNHFFGKTHKEEARKKMWEAKLNRTLSDEVKEKISRGKSGKFFTEEHKMALSLSKKNSKKLSVLNIQTNEETIFHSISQAERSMGFPRGAIGLNLKSKLGLLYRGTYKLALVGN
jgi:group I intron endonuclease